MRRTFLLAAMLPVFTGLADPVDDLVRREMASHRIPGLTLAVARTGEKTRSAAYGFANLEWNIPATPETVFEVGSVTKQFTAACILLLAEEGRLALDDRISRYLPGAPASWSGITIRHLLTHTSGLRNYTGLDGFEWSRHLAPEQFIAKIGEQPPVFPPGEKFSYCNTGYNLLGYIIQNVSGEPYWNYLTRKILRPLGMTATTNREPSRILPWRAAGYDPDQTNGLVNRDVNYTDLFSAGEMVSTIGDLMKWNAALGTGQLLKQTSEKEMWTSGKLQDGRTTGYGFGWFLGDLDGHKIMSHPGSTSGFAAANLRCPDDGLMIVVLCNSGEDGAADQIAREIARLYFAGKTR